MFCIPTKRSTVSHAGLKNRLKHLSGEPPKYEITVDGPVSFQFDDPVRITVKSKIALADSSGSEEEPELQFEPAFNVFVNVLSKAYEFKQEPLKKDDDDDDDDGGDDDNDDDDDDGPVYMICLILHLWCNISYRKCEIIRTVGKRNVVQLHG